LDDPATQECDQEEAQKNPQRCESAAAVVADCREDRDASVAGAAFEIAAAEVTFGLEVADHGLDGGSASQFALDDTEHAAPLSRDEDGVDSPSHSPRYPLSI
jgi:hypothetical protein